MPTFSATKNDGLTRLDDEIDYEGSSPVRQLLSASPTGRSLTTYKLLEDQQGPGLDSQRRQSKKDRPKCRTWQSPWPSNLHVNKVGYPLPGCVARGPMRARDNGQFCRRRDSVEYPQICPRLPICRRASVGTMEGRVGSSFTH